MENHDASMSNILPTIHESEPAAVGPRLREIRNELGLSQRELARRSGVTNGMISLIEQDKASPSVALLKKVLVGIPMSLAEFFSPPQTTEPQAFFSAAELTSLDSGEIRFRQVGAQVPGRTLQVMTETYPPGADTGEAMLQHEAQEGGIIIRGQVEITAGHQTRVLGPGDAYYFDSRTPHRFRNIGSEECELFSACTPPTF